MAFLELILLGLSQLRTNAMRSILTILGITIGIGSVLGVVSISEGLRHSVISQFSQVGGASLIVVVPPRSWEMRNGTRINRTWREYLTARDVVSFTEEVVDIRDALPVINWNSTARHRKATATAQVLGTLPGYDQAMDWDLDTGRFITDWDVRTWRRVCVLGDEIRDDLFPSVDPIGREIKIGGERYTVVGAMKPRVFFGQNYGNQIVVPVTTLQKRVRGNDRYDIVYVHVDQAADVSEVSAGIRRTLSRAHVHGSEFRIITGEAQIQQVEKVTGILKLVTGGIAAISLLVGGVGIMNIMLVSVTERTREIGIRKALGAKDRHILAQFVVEAIVLSCFGGVLGILSGIGIGEGISLLIERFSEADFPSRIDPAAVAISFAVSGGIGLFFGVYPAARASKLDPVDALRYE